MSESMPLKRPRFFSGKLVTLADLELEQQYVLNKLKRHNRTLHGFGIVSGLRVTVDSRQIVIEPGLALDCEGNELAVETVQSLAPPASVNSQIAYLNLGFVEERGDPVPTAGGAEASTITESFALAFAPENSNRGHRHLRARWLACGKPHALTIAKLRSGSHGWRVDRGYRPPVIK